MSLQSLLDPMALSEVTKKRLPMLITASRIVITPLVILLLVQNELWPHVWAAIVFILASCTDYFDGYFARKYNAITNMGKFMDPVADKILVTSILVVLVTLDKIDPYLVIIILARDILIGGIRQVAAADQIVIAAQSQGKWKTALQMVAIPAVMIDEKWIGIPFDKVGYWVLWVSVILAVTSGIQYTQAYFRSVKKPLI